MGSVGKFKPQWGGPYQVTHKLSLGAYYLEASNDKELDRPWQVVN